MIPPQWFIDYGDCKVITNDFNASSLLPPHPHRANKVCWPPHLLEW